MKVTTSFKITAILAGLVLTNVANAAFPNGLWQVDQYDFVTKTKINTVTACINSNGTLKLGASMTTIDWNGNWKKNGDLLLLKMNNIDGKSVATYSLIESSANIMTGYNQSWNMFSGTSGGFYANAVWTFKSATC
jgi:hypothetical protein